MVLSVINLRDGVEEIQRQEERAGDEVLRALRMAVGVCKELMLFSPKQVTEGGKYVMLTHDGVPIYKVEYRHYTDQIVVTGDWQVTAEYKRSPFSGPTRETV